MLIFELFWGRKSSIPLLAGIEAPPCLMHWIFLICIKKETGIFMYKYNNNIWPHSFDGLFINNLSNHIYNTRNKDDYQFHMFRLNTVLNTGPKIWNNLPKHIKYSKTSGQFKRNIVSYLNSGISQLHFRSGKNSYWLFIWSKQITKCNLVFNDELFHVHAY